MRNQLTTCFGERLHLIGRRSRICGVGVGHGLHDDGMAAADRHAAYFDRR
jgi:hypothetical protein